MPLHSSRLPSAKRSLDSAWLYLALARISLDWAVARSPALNRGAKVGLNHLAVHFSWRFKLGKRYLSARPSARIPMD
jgi:hypothetical protein